MAPSPLISVDELSEALRGPKPPMLLDVRWSLQQPDGSEAYREGHLPGAVYVSLDDELSNLAGEATEGRHPLPTTEALQAAARSWGLNDGDEVVVYDDVSGPAAARAWWLLRRNGVHTVRVLDGGLQAWITAGGRLEEGEVRPRSGTVTLVPTPEAAPAIDRDAVPGYAASGLLVDVRAPERFSGESEPVDPVAGHIDGAVNLPMSRLTRDGGIAEPALVRDELDRLGVHLDREVALYCGSGVTAAGAALALEAAGLRAVVYPASWSGWIAQ
ncbi:sulfurtransferase [Leucobacter chinensis]|uniref:sulfurtransferase n=1 Tax=Leucobacter chinensis TaxID=2851010 RepID=UPI001C2199A5